MSLIEIRHVRKEYANAVLLKDVNATIEKGEVVSIIGPSGTGKSTLLRCINRLETPTSGEILVDGVNMCDPSTDLPKMRRKMGMVFQDYSLFEHRLVVENLMMAPIDLLGMSKQEAWDRSIRLLDMVGLKDKADAWPYELSGGQRQRVAIARSLSMDPSILLLDEPTSSLDPAMELEVLSVVKDLTDRGLTMIVVTHEPRFAKEASSRVFFMYGGEIWEEGTPKQIFEKPLRPETHDFVFRVRSWEYAINSLSFDLPGMVASLQVYCAHQFLGIRATNACESIVEEIVIRQLVEVARRRGISNPNIRAELFAGEGGVDISLKVDYRTLLQTGDPFAEGGVDEFSRALVMGRVQKTATIEPGVVRYYLKRL